MTDTIMNVHEAINEVSRQVGGLSKDGFNEHQRYSFRGIDQLITTVQPVLNNVGVTIVPKVISYESQDRQTANNIQRWCTVLMKYTITGPAGDTVESVIVGEAADVADKAMNKALSNAAKYFYFQTFWFGIGGMDEGDLDHPEAAPVQRQAPQGNPQPARQAPQNNSRPATSGSSSGNAVTEPQRKKIWAMAHKSLDWDDDKMYQQIEITLGTPVTPLEMLTKSQASKVIEDFQSHIDNASQPAQLEEF